MENMSMSEIDEEINKLNTEISKEQDAAQMLVQSKEELKITINELHTELEELEEDDSEDQWKVRHDEQYEMNTHLEKQIAMLKEKLKELKEETMKAGNSISRKTYDIDELGEVELRRLTKKLQREKLELDGTLKDFHWQLDTESKAVSKINDEISEYRAGLTEAQGKIREGKLRENISQETPRRKEMKNVKYNSLRGPRIASKDRYYGIPDNQRIIDPRKGPVKRTAVVGHLPKLDSRDDHTSVKSSPGPQKSIKNVPLRGFSSAEENRQKYSVHSRRSDPL